MGFKDNAGKSINSLGVLRKIAVRGRVRVGVRVVVGMNSYGVLRKRRVRVRVRVSLRVRVRVGVGVKGQCRNIDQQSWGFNDILGSLINSMGVLSFTVWVLRTMQENRSTVLGF